MALASRLSARLLALACLFFLLIYRPVCVRDGHYVIGIDGQEWILCNHGFKLIDVFTQCIAEFGHNGIQLFGIAHSDSLSTQLSDSSFQGYIVDHSTPLAESFHGTRLASIPYKPYYVMSLSAWRWI
jgi:hypothetical protein